MPKSDRKSSISLLTAVVLLLLVAWAGAATMLVFRADLTRTETLRTLRNDVEGRSLAMEEKIRNLEKTIANLRTGTETGRTTISTANLFSVSKVKIGDTVVGLKVASVKKLTENPNVPFGPENASIVFKGKLTLSGDYVYYTKDGAMPASQVCISNLTPESKALLPMDESHAAAISLICFTNNDEAQKAFGAQNNRGKTTVEIEDYTLNAGNIEITDTAKLVRVIAK